MTTHYITAERELCVPLTTALAMPVTYMNGNTDDLAQVPEADEYELWTNRGAIDEVDGVAEVAQELLARGSPVYLVEVEALDRLSKKQLRAARKARIELMADDDDPDGATTDIETLRGSQDLTEVIRYFNAKHFVARATSKVVIGTLVLEHDGTENVVFQTVQDLRLEYSDWDVDGTPVAKLWLASPGRRSYKGFVNAPGEPAVTKGYFNLNRGFAVDPEPGDCSLYREHVRDVICKGDPSRFDYVWKWLAHCVQKPQVRPEVALVLIGGQGVGKGSFVTLFGHLFGRHFMVVYHCRQLTGRFNAHLRDALLIFADEAIWDGGRGAVGALKGLITDPFFPIEHKGSDILRLPNFRRLIASSNYSTPVHTDMDDRRFFVMRVSDHRRGNLAYFRALHEQMEAGGYAALMHELLQVDLSSFSVRTPPPTPEGFELKMENADTTVKWWYACLQCGGLIGGPTEWPDVIATASLYDAYGRWCDDHGQRRQPHNVLGRDLAQMLDDSSFRRARPGTGTFRPWMYVLPGIAEGRAAFERFAKVDAAIWDDETE